uniref:Uncharacterized protein n=1 Tax=Arundo donax TaxID=35708 RepID=A0A0A8ZHL8_ARUDO
MLLSLFIASATGLMMLFVLLLIL